ncbi:unnamed protein product [Rotaria sp. Silwood1]|nr:unnamed protein product [Rotaria sp. Silwood1]CAF3520023.1 unnamed protein product [Rotaria sp. Silwood1]CAF3577449.1 unnamed protein product [Rotaria sp. Silwood1]
MNENFTDDHAILVENSFAAQHRHVGNEQRENSTQNQFNSAEGTMVTNKTKVSPMTPTPLEFSCWSRHRSSIAVGAFAVFTIIAITIGVLTVCFTSSKATGMFFFIDILATFVGKIRLYGGSVTK